MTKFKSNIDWPNALIKINDRKVPAVKRIIELTRSGDIHWNSNHVARYKKWQLYFCLDGKFIAINRTWPLNDIPRELMDELNDAINHQLCPDLNEFIDSLLREENE